MAGKAVERALIYTIYDPLICGLGYTRFLAVDPLDETPPIYGVDLGTGTAIGGFTPEYLEHICQEAGIPILRPMRPAQPARIPWREASS